MSLTESVRTCLSKYVTFQGRAERSEYWWFVLAYVIAIIVATVIDNAIIGQPILTTIVSLGSILPLLAVTVRRLHDTDRSGWWIFLGFVPLIGAILLLVWYASAGTDGPNRFDV